jgi:uncharacterized protein (TIGR03382 family)
VKKLAVLVLLSTAFVASDAMAFCGFYVGGAGSDLYANATQVALMREGTKTVLSMQNRYDGPAADFAMVIPVPVVLQQADVKTLEDAVFSKLDVLTAPRLVEYFEEDPCYVDEWENFSNNSVQDSGSNSTNNSVTVEAQFKVGEYDIAILSAQDSTGLETYLSDNDYTIPAGAAPYFEPYVQAGMYFFVAKVDVALTKKVNGKTVLSPLRFAYESTDFSLPVRLGMINSQGTQDLLIYTLGLGQRYDLSNRPNVTIPTNIEVVDGIRNSFGAFYQSLFARTLKENPDAVVTEYSWAASNCDPCPGPVLDSADLLTLGADLFPGTEENFDWVVTRLHARYDKGEVGEDLVFKKADPIVGGREFVVDQQTGKLEEGSQVSDRNNFQGRYIIRKAWNGPIECEEPRRGNWGYGVSTDPSPNTTGTDVVLDANRDLAPDIIGSVPELGITGSGIRTAGSPVPGVTDPSTDGQVTGAKGEADSGCSATEFGAVPFALGFLALGLRRRRRKK